jgi:hypothetical protein
LLQASRRTAATVLAASAKTLRHFENGSLAVAAKRLRVEFKISKSKRFRRAGRGCGRRPFVVRSWRTPASAKVNRTAG